MNILSSMPINRLQVGRRLETLFDITFNGEFNAYFVLNIVRAFLSSLIK